MKKLQALIPLDGSEFSKQVLPHVKSILKPADYELTLLRVAEPPKDVNPLPPPARPITVDGYTTYKDVYDQATRDLLEHPIYSDQLWESARAKLLDDLAEVAEDLEKSGFNTHRVVHFGEPVHEITSYAQDEAIDLICMATHGRSGLRQVLMGSVAQGVIKQVSIPVIMLRPVVVAQPA